MHRHRHTHTPKCYERHFCGRAGVCVWSCVCATHMYKHIWRRRRRQIGRLVLAIVCVKVWFPFDYDDTNITSMLLQKHTHTSTHSHKPTHTQTHTNTNTHTHTQTHTQTHTHTQVD